jgi:hypothetical protein
MSDVWTRPINQGGERDKLYFAIQAWRRVARCRYRKDPDNLTPILSYYEDKGWEVYQHEIMNSADYRFSIAVAWGDVVSEYTKGASSRIFEIMKEGN